MKKTLALLLVLTFILGGCGKVNDAVIAEPTTSDVQTSENSNDDIYYSCTGNFCGESSEDVVKACVEDDNQAYLLVESQNKTYRYDIGAVETWAFETGYISSADVDGDGIDEIVFWVEITANGYTNACIYKIIDGEIKRIFDANERTDVVYSYIDGGKLAIENKEIDFCYTVDISDIFFEEKYDENGKYIGYEEVREIPVSYLTALTDDASSETVISYAYSIGLLRGIGTIVVNLTYDSVKADFIVSDIVVIEFASDDIESSLDKEYELSLSKAASNVDKSAVNDEYASLWKEKADEYYDALISYYSSDEERFNDRYISPEDMIENMQSMKTERRSYIEKQIEFYEAHLISKYGSGSILPGALSKYKLDMYRDEALEVYQMCIDLNIDVEAP